MTVTPRGVSVSAGVKGARMSVNSSGRTTRTLSLPGTGISRVTTSSGRSAPRSQGVANSFAGAAREGFTDQLRAEGKPVNASGAPKPGLLAPRWEKDLHKALLAPSAEAFLRVGREHSEAQQLAAFFEAFTIALPAGDHARTRELAAWLFGNSFDPAANPFMHKYAGASLVTVGLAEGITVELQLDRDVLGLVLAELHQEAGDLDAAVDVVEGLEPTTLTAVSLAELYGQQQRWKDIIELTEGLTNDDEPSVFLLTQRGAAFRELGFYDAAREALKEALRLRSRPAELMHLALLERAAIYVAQGKNSMARRDLERIMAANSSHPGLAEALAQLPT